MDLFKKIAKFDLNLLLVFLAIDQHRHVTKAANALGMSQSALSHALNRLRNLLDDKLFVKSSNGMVPTSKAEKLSAPVRSLLTNFDHEILGETKFDPKTLSRTFRISSTDLIESILFPKLLQVLEKEAPKVRVIGKAASFSLPQDELELGKCDIAIAGFFGELPDGFYQQKLFTDSFFCAVRKKHPRLGNKNEISLEEYCDDRHVLIAPGGELSAKVDAIIKRKKQERFTVAGLSGFMVSGWVVSQSDSILTAPSLLIRELSRSFSLQSFKPPFEIPAITIVQAWHERNNQDFGHRWLREKIKQILQK